MQNSLVNVHLSSEFCDEHCLILNSKKQILASKLTMIMKPNIMNSYLLLVIESDVAKKLSSLTIDWILEALDSKRRRQILIV